MGEIEDREADQRRILGRKNMHRSIDWLDHGGSYEFKGDISVVADFLYF